MSESSEKKSNRPSKNMSPDNVPFEVRIKRLETELKVQRRLIDEIETDIEMLWGEMKRGGVGGNAVTVETIKSFLDHIKKKRKTKTSEVEED